MTGPETDTGEVDAADRRHDLDREADDREAKRYPFLDTAALSRRLAPQLAALPPSGGHVRDPGPGGRAYFARPADGNYILEPACQWTVKDAAGKVGPCTRPYRADGGCDLHYSRNRRHRNGESAPPMDAPPKPRPEDPFTWTFRVKVPEGLRMAVLRRHARDGGEDLSGWMRAALEAYANRP